MSDKNTSLPWLERLKMELPGYGGYHSAEHQREADVQLRGAITHTLASAEKCLRAAAVDCRKREAESEAQTLERVIQHMHEVGGRVGSAAAGSGIQPASRPGDDRHAKAETLHALDHALLDISREFLKLCEQPSVGVDWVVKLQSVLNRMDRKLDARAYLHRLLLEGGA